MNCIWLTAPETGLESFKPGLVVPPVLGFSHSLSLKSHGAGQVELRKENRRSTVWGVSKGLHLLSAGLLVPYFYFGQFLHHLGACDSFQARMALKLGKTWTSESLGSPPDGSDTHLSENVVLDQWFLAALAA